MLERTLRRLAGLGVTEPDVWRVEYHLSDACAQLRAECDLDPLPEPLEHAAVEMAAGAYLRDVQNGVTSVSIGDTSVHFDATLIERLEGARRACAYYRKVNF